MSDVNREVTGHVYRVRKTTPKRTRWAGGRPGAVNFTQAEVTPQGLPRDASPAAKRGTGDVAPKLSDEPAGQESGERKYKRREEHQLG